jgi:hypothetical protein
MPCPRRSVLNLFILTIIRDRSRNFKSTRTVDQDFCEQIRMVERSVTQIAALLDG